MVNIRSPRTLHLKGALFILVGCVASALLANQNPGVRVGILLGVAVWAFARAYSYAFYMIEHHIDDGYRFSGPLSFARYALRRRKTHAPMIDQH